MADVEGTGSFNISRSPEHICIWIDGALNLKCSLRFQDSLIITTSDCGPSEISVCGGDRSAVANGRVTECDTFAGCGWILRSQSISSVDGVVEGWGKMAQSQPVPVFNLAVGRGLVVEPAPFRCEELARVSMNDPDGLISHGWKVKNASNLFVVESGLGGLGRLQASALSHLNAGGFRFFKPFGCTGVIVRKLYDAFHGRQRARVLVNGIFQGWWFEPFEDRECRWKWGHFGFRTDEPAEDLRIELDPPAGTPLWSVSRYEVWGLFPHDETFS